MIKEAIKERLVQFPDKLPSCSDYAVLLNEYATLNRMGLAFARDRVGQWTGEQWLEWLNTGPLAEDTSDMLLHAIRVMGHVLIPCNWYDNKEWSEQIRKVYDCSDSNKSNKAIVEAIESIPLELYRYPNGDVKVKFIKQ